MRVLIDTHIFLWAIAGDDRLSDDHRAIYLDHASRLYLSVASVWEMLTRFGAGKLDLPSPASGFIFRQIEKNRIEMLTIRAAHLTELESIPPIHRDPFDRMMVAQARAEGMPIVSADPALRRYPVRVL